MVTQVPYVGVLVQVIVSAGIRDEIFIWNPFVEKRVNELVGHKAPMLGLHLAVSRAGAAYQLLSSDRYVERACVSTPAHACVSTPAQAAHIISSLPIGHYYHKATYTSSLRPRTLVA